MLEWAAWSPAAAERPWTVGIEEEVLLLDPHDWSPANRVDDVLAALPSHLSAHACAETHACVVELRTGPHDTVRDAVDELRQLRDGLNAVVAGRLGLRAAVAGTHPLARGEDVETASGARYREVEATMRALAHREPTMAQHVHVAMPDGDTAVRALDRVRGALPLLLALSANSPFWRGADSGFASMRTPLFGAFPRTGMPRRFGNYGAYVRTVEQLLWTGAIPEPSFVWWDARLQPRLGTLEVRIMDAQSRTTDAGALAAVVQCLARRAGVESCMAAPELLAENRFLAARDGMRAQIVDPTLLEPRPMTTCVAHLLAACAPVARRLGCEEELAAAAELAVASGDARQREWARQHGIAAVPARLAAQFAPARETAVA
ncbi:MAG TPA: YbdK family carboxylate-amine ligase [Solirubrobacter sp.]